MALRQKNTSSGDPLLAQATDHLLCGQLAALVLIRIERQIDGAPGVTQLTELVGVDMRAQCTGHVGKARLPQDGIVEQSLDQDDRGEVPHLRPAIQAALAAWQEAMRKGGAEAAAVEVDDVLALA